MSGECDDCGEHPSDCQCYEKRAQHHAKLCPIDLVDLCDDVKELTNCLAYVMENEEYKNLTVSYHWQLVRIIERKLKEIQKSLKEL